MVSDQEPLCPVEEHLQRYLDFHLSADEIVNFEELVRSLDPLSKDPFFFATTEESAWQHVVFSATFDSVKV